MSLLAIWLLASCGGEKHRSEFEIHALCIKESDIQVIEPLAISYLNKNFALNQGFEIKNLKNQKFQEALLVGDEDEDGRGKAIFVNVVRDGKLIFNMNNFANKKNVIILHSTSRIAIGLVREISKVGLPVQIESFGPDGTVPLDQCDH